MVVSVQGAIRDSIHGDLRIRAFRVYFGRYMAERVMHEVGGISTQCGWPNGKCACRDFVNMGV